MSYTTSYLSTIKKCVDKAIAQISVKVASKGLYLIGDCVDCNKLDADLPTLIGWKHVLDSWDNDPDADDNVITQAELLTVVEQINNVLECNSGTVTTGSIGWSTIDPMIALNAATDNLVYAEAISFITGGPITANFRPSGTQKYFYLRLSSTERALTSWYNSFNNSGNLPDSIWPSNRKVTFGGKTYYVSVQTDLDPNNDTTFL
jgi:hypothetical protein